MSNFLTKIPISVDETKKLLPNGASVERVTFNPQTSEIELTWHHPRLHSGYTFPAPFTIDQLKNKELPKGVKDLPQGPRHPHLQMEKKPETAALETFVDKLVTPKVKRAAKKQATLLQGIP